MSYHISSHIIYRAPQVLKTHIYHIETASDCSGQHLAAPDQAVSCMWRQTGSCKANGAREPDRPFGSFKGDIDRAPLKCIDIDMDM